MATLTATRYASYYYTYSGSGSSTTISSGPHSTSSYYLGGENGNNRIVAYKITTPATGITQLSFSLSPSSYTTGYSDHTSAKAGGYLKYCITTSTTCPHPANTASLGTITATNTSISTSTITCILNPNTTYYLWIFSSQYYQGYWNVEDKNVTITYEGGVVRIYTADGWKMAIPYVYTANGWKQAIPYVYTANGWKNTC